MQLSICRWRCWSGAEWKAARMLLLSLNLSCCWLRVEGVLLAQRLWQARSAELLLCPLWVAARPAGAVGVGGSLLNTVKNFCCIQWALVALC